MSSWQPRHRAARAAVALSLVVVMSACSTLNPTPTPTATSSPSPSLAPSPSPMPTPTVEPSPTPIPLDQEMLARRFTVLVAGADSSLSRRNGGLDDWNTDALMVISVSADQSQIAIFSVPRDTVDVPMADGTIYRGKVNGIAERFGMDALRGAIATLLGIPIDRYIAVDMDDFVWMVDAVGGIRVEVATRLVDPKVHLNLEPGPTHLDGATALRYARTRADTDYGRAARQQQVVLALVHQWLDPGAAGLFAAVRLLGSLETDISLTEIPTLLEIGRRSSSADLTAIVLQPPRFSLFAGIEPNSYRGWVMIPDVGAMRAYVQQVLSG